MAKWEDLKNILTVHLATRPNLRDDELFVYIGQKFLMDLFDDPDKDLTTTTKVQLIYPERWLNVVEQRILYDAILDRCPNIAEIFIKTHSAYILQCTPNGCAFIIDKPSDYPDQSYKRDARYSPVPKESGGLQIFKIG